jgi:hypothetical protein
MTTLERCDCQDLRDAVGEGVITEQVWGKDGEKRTVYLLNHPSGDEDEGLLMLFCPFCGRLAGDALAMRRELWADN